MTSTCSSIRRPRFSNVSQGLELDLAPADADAQAQPAAREHVHRGRLLGDEGRLPLSEDEDAGDQLDTAGDRSAEAEQDEGLVQGGAVIVRAVPAARAGGVGAGPAV